MVIAWTLGLVSCEREVRDLRPSPASSATVRRVSLGLSNVSSAPPRSAPEKGWVAVLGPYGGNAYAVAEGKRLFAAFNCAGCHANGGGGMGPALMDADKCLTCRNAYDVFATIVRGRRNGMPAFGARIPEYQIWQIAAYVQSMSGLVRMDVAPGRNDDMDVRPPESSMRHTPHGSRPPPERTR
jgi:cytochrome c oxidase cbb3-type subunit 3